MKFIITSLFITTLTTTAADKTFRCTLNEGDESGGRPQQTQALPAPPTSAEQLTITFPSAVSSDLKIEGRYSPQLNSIDAEITDLKTGYKANATDWFNSKDENAHASLVFHTPSNQSFILQCTKH